MSVEGKILWSSGLFLRPEHFQSQERYQADQLRLRTGDLGCHLWGMAALQFDEELLRHGKIAVKSARGAFRDGTAFDAPGRDRAPDALTVTKDMRDVLILLALPERSGDAPDIASEGATRFRRATITALDAIADPAGGVPEKVEIDLLRLDLRLMFSTQEHIGFDVLPIARVIEVGTDGAVSLDRSFMGPCLTCAAQDALVKTIRDLTYLLSSRSAALANRLSGQGKQQGGADLQDYLSLSVINSHLTVLRHFGRDEGRHVHPEALFRVLLALAGGLSTYATREHEPPEFMPYDHDTPEPAFRSVGDYLVRMLTALLIDSAVRIPLQEMGHGVLVGYVNDSSLLASARFVLMVRADIATEELAAEFPKRLKIGCGRNIAELVNSALTGIPVQLRPVAPRELPFAPRTLYFELDRSANFDRDWREILNNGNIALHASGKFPGLSLDLWAIRAPSEGA